VRTHNAFRAAIENDETVFGAACGTFSPTVIELLGNLGLDFVWLDFEHGGPSPYDSTVFEELTRAAEAGDIELLVRIPKPEPHSSERYSMPVCGRFLSRASRPPTNSPSTRSRPFRLRRRRG